MTTKTKQNQNKTQVNKKKINRFYLNSKTKYDVTKKKRKHCDEK